MRPAGRVWRKTGWAARRGIPTGRRATHAVKVEAARQRVVLTPANSPDLNAALDDLYVLVVGPPPPGSKPLKKVTA
jgi:hypothetical protein